MDKPPNFDLKGDRTHGDTIRILRELCEWSQKDLEAKCQRGSNLDKVHMIVNHVND